MAPRENTSWFVQDIQMKWFSSLPIPPEDIKAAGLNGSYVERKQRSENLPSPRGKYGAWSLVKGPGKTKKGQGVFEEHKALTG